MLRPVLPKEVKLFFQEGNSDKVYYARIVPAGASVYDVVVQWGRRGSTLSSGKKAVKVSLEKAQVTLDRLVREKTNKGYEAMSGKVKPAEVAPPVGEGSASKAGGIRKKVGRVAQLLNPVEVHEVERLLSDDQVLAQQKLDGNRVLCHVEDGEVLPTNRAGQKTNVSAKVLGGLIHLPKGTVVDGEVVGEVYWLFDVLQIGSRDVTSASYVERFSILSDELEPGLSEPVRVLESAVTTKQKKGLYERLQASSAEGIVFKRKDAPYTPGRGSTQLKCKFVSSADVVLVENAGNAYRMQVFDGGKAFDVGKVFSGTTNESRAHIDAALGRGERLVAEVRYLYATADSQLFQPIFVRVRSDKKEKDCVRGQLKSTNREVVDGDGE